MIKCSYHFDYYLIHVLNELLWACNNDCVMFVHYMSFDMRINNKYLLNWTETEWLLKHADYFSITSFISLRQKYLNNILSVLKCYKLLLKLLQQMKNAQCPIQLVLLEKHHQNLGDKIDFFHIVINRT